MRKIMLYVIGGILILLFITNPTLSDLKEHIGKIDKNETVEKTANYLIFSIYYDDGYKPTYYSDSYIGILGNFYVMKHKGAGD